MKKSRRGPLVMNDISELDKLVLGELYAIKNKILKEQSYSDRSRREDNHEEDRYYDDIGIKERSLKKKQSRPQKMNRKEMDYFSRELEAGSIDSPLSEETGQEERIWEEPYNTSSENNLDRDYPEESKELLNEEEEKFIHNMVEWLRPRENKDVIVSKIWSLLTESESESFYYPESGKRQDQSEASDLSKDNKKLEERSPKKVQMNSKPSGPSDNSKKKSEGKIDRIK